jgi:Meiotically up-regulated gene 113
MNNPRGKFAKVYSEEVKKLEQRFLQGENYIKLQSELDCITKDFVNKCFRFKIGDIVTCERNAKIKPIDYNLDYAFNNVNFDLIIDFAYDGYDKGLNRIELLQITADSEHFHHMFEGNYLFCSFYGWTKDWKEKRAENETESYITLKYDLYENKIAYFIRSMIIVPEGDSFQKVGEIEYDITKKIDTQDLYFLRDENNSIKIGISNDVIKRILELSSAMRQRIDIIRVINNGGKYERLLHRKFDHLREKRIEKVDGYTEWFAPEKELIDFISNFSLEES